MSAIAHPDEPTSVPCSCGARIHIRHDPARDAILYRHGEGEAARSFPREQLHDWLWHGLDRGERHPMHAWVDEVHRYEHPDA